MQKGKIYFREMQKINYSNKKRQKILYLPNRKLY